MKKQLYLIALLLLSTFAVNAQSAFTATYPTFTDTTVYPNIIDVINGSVHNNHTTSTTLTMQIVNSNLPSDWGVSMCIQGNCYAVGILSHTFTIAPSANAGTEVDFHIGTITGTGYATIKFTNNADTSDNVTLYFSATLDPTSSIANANSANSISLSQNFPNPFSDQTKIAYSITGNDNANFVVYDMNGKVLKQLSIENKEGEIILSANDFPSGTYFYTIERNNKAIVTKKFIVN